MATLSQRFRHFAETTARNTGRPAAFLLAVLVVLVWAATGPLFHFGDTWQLVINTGTTIITFLMVFLIQKSQNKDSLAMQIKLNELIAVNRKASNRLLNLEDLNEADLIALHQFFGRLAEKAKQEDSLSESHSIEEAEEIHFEKQEEKKQRKQKKTSKTSPQSTQASTL